VVEKVEQAWGGMDRENRGGVDPCARAGGGTGVWVQQWRRAEAW
jgi:hypothetical protein